MKAIFTIVILIFTSANVRGQIQFDSVSTTNFYDIFTPSITLPHTCSGTSRVLVVSVMNCGGVSGVYGLCYAQIASITYNGANMNLLAADSVIPGLYAHSTCWYLANPPSGTHNIVINFSDYARSAIVAAFSFSGANTSSPFGSLIQSHANGPSISLPISTTAPNSIIVDFVGSTNATSSTTITFDAFQTVKYNSDVPTNGIEGAGGYRYTPSIGTYTSTQSGYAGGSPLFAIGLEIKATNASTLPIISSPTYNSITSGSAILGSTIISDGGCPLTARGICWGTSIGNVTNCVNDIGTSVGLFSQTITGLPSSTVIYYKGFATNCVGTAYTAIDNFTTNQSTTGIQNVFSNKNICFYPNPATNQLAIITEEDFSTITICDALGHLMFQNAVVKGISTIDVSRFPNGLYFIKVTSKGNQPIGTAKFFKNTL